MKIYRGTYPRSSELYHHGILGQKWGVRRFQNPDGSLTAEGRERYGSGNSGSAGERFKTGARHVGNAIGKAAKATGKAVGKAAVVAAKAGVRRLKETHPWLMTNDELAEYTKRLTAEKNVSEMRKAIRGNTGSNARKVIGNILENGAKTLTDAGFKKIASEIQRSSLDRESDRTRKQLDIARNKADYVEQQGRMSEVRRNVELMRIYNTLAEKPPKEGTISRKLYDNRVNEAIDELIRYNDALDIFGWGKVELPKYKKDKK